MKNVEQLFLGPHESIHRAIQVIDAAAVQIALVVDEIKTLVGTVTDGDVRRGLLRGLTLKDPVSDVMNVNYTFITPDMGREKVVFIMDANFLNQIPVLNFEGMVVGMEFREERKQRVSFPNSIVFMAGGAGTRLRPLTETLPKPMVSIGGKPMLERLIEKCKMQGFNHFMISVNYHKDKIIDYFGHGTNWDVKIEYINEERPLGTAGSLSLIRNRSQHPVVVINADVVSQIHLPSLLRFHEEHGASATMCVKSHETQIPFGVVETDGVHMHSLLEKPILTHFVNAGVYVINSELLSLIPSGERYDMTDLFNQARELGKKVTVFPIHEYWIDVGTPSSLGKANGDWH
jgi:dTDP-glucose pyrophosphorylase